MRLKLLVVALLGVVGIGAIGFALAGANANAAETVEYLTATAAVGDVTDDVAATGALASSLRSATAFGVDPWLVTDGANPPDSAHAWPVEAVEVTVSDRVAAGDVLATADASAASADLRDARRALLSAKNTLRTAEDELIDADETDDTNRRLQARNSLYDAQTRLAQAEQDVADLEAIVALATITAPIEGVVTEVNITAGFDAPSGAAIVIDSATYEVTTDVVEDDLGDIELGQAATVVVDAIGAEVQGTVSAISPIATDGGDVVSYPVTVTLDSAPEGARSGMTAEVTITIATAQGVVTVPASALQGSAGSYSVLVLDAAGQPVSQPVEVGLVTSARVEVISGLAAGAQVVTGTTADLIENSTNGGFPGGGGVIRDGGGPAVNEFRPAP